MVIDPHVVDLRSDTETINYSEDDYIGEMVPETRDKQQPIPQEILDSLTRTDSTPSPLPQDGKLLPEINQVTEHEVIIINDGDDINLNISQNYKWDRNYK